MFPFHHSRDMEDASSLRNIIRYINFLYGIELLRNSNIANVDQMLAWQYGQCYNTPWKDNDVLVYKFFTEHKTELYAYNIQKFTALTNKLLKEIENFKTEVYVKVALDPQTVNSLAAGLQEVTTDNNLMRSFMSEAQVNPSLNATAQPRMIRHYRGAFAGIEVADRVLCGIFDEWTQNRPLLNTHEAKHRYGADRQDILDNRVYACTCWMKKQLLEALNVTSHPHTFAQAFSLYTSFFHLYASLFSILFRMVIPEGMHPNRLDRMYAKYIETHDKYHQYLCKARRASGLTAEVVAGDTIPLINKAYLENTVVCGNDPEHHARFLYTATYPDSLVEKYLMTEYLVEKEV